MPLLRPTLPFWNLLALQRATIDQEDLGKSYVYSIDGRGQKAIKYLGLSHELKRY
jgi:hypothetical protein